MARPFFASFFIPPPPPQKKSIVVVSVNVCFGLRGFKETVNGRKRHLVVIDKVGYSSKFIDNLGFFYVQI